MFTTHILRWHLQRRCNLPNSPVGISGIKTTDGLSNRYRQAKSSFVRALVPGNKTVYHHASSKKPLTRNKFQPGLLNGDTMSPTTGNGGVNKCPIANLDTCIYKGVAYELPCYFSYYPQQFTIRLANKGITVLGIGQGPTNI